MALRELDIAASSASASSVSSMHGMLVEDSDSDFLSLEENGSAEWWWRRLRCAR